MKSENHRYTCDIKSKVFQGGRLILRRPKLRKRDPESRLIVSSNKPWPVPKVTVLSTLAKDSGAGPGASGLLGPSSWAPNSVLPYHSTRAGEREYLFSPCINSAIFKGAPVQICSWDADIWKLITFPDERKCVGSTTSSDANKEGKAYLVRLDYYSNLSRFQ